MQEKSFKAAVEQAQSLARKFAKIDPKPWPPEVKAVDLQAHVGRLAQAILEREGFKSSRDASAALGRHLATIFFILLDIADTANVNFQGAFDALLAEVEADLAKHTKEGQNEHPAP